MKAFKTTWAHCASRFFCWQSAVLTLPLMLFLLLTACNRVGEKTPGTILFHLAGGLGTVISNSSGQNNLVRIVQLPGKSDSTGGSLPDSFQVGGVVVFSTAPVATPVIGQLYALTCTVSTSSVEWNLTGNGSWATCSLSTTCRNSCTTGTLLNAGGYPAGVSGSTYNTIQFLSDKCTQPSPSLASSCYSSTNTGETTGITLNCAIVLDGSSNVVGLDFVGATSIKPGSGE